MPNPYPNAVFSLLPLNPKAEAVTTDLRNRHLAFKIHHNHGHDHDNDVSPKFALSVGFHVPSTTRDSHTLALLGRGDDVDIYLQGATISKSQCSFEVNLDTKVVMLYDRSTARTTQVYGQNATSFQHERPLPRRVVVDRGLNDLIGIGGAARNFIQFQLEWPEDSAQTKKVIETRQSLAGSYREESETDSRAAHTLSQDTELPSRMDTRPYTPAQLKMRYNELHMLGSGNFGAVFKALDYDSGRFMAVKKLIIKSDQELMYARKREVETLAPIHHPLIIEFIYFEGWGTRDVSIFMGLKDGSLGSLIKKDDEMGSSQQVQHVAQVVVVQMLQALDFLAFNKIVHRDVKPDNILYSAPCKAGDYCFQLGDFGLCNPYNNANSGVVTPIFAAPERSDTQTPKFDVWSLMVTLLWTLNPDNFIRNMEQVETPQQIVAFIVKVAGKTGLKLFVSMAKFNPNERASAAQLLLTWFDGKGLTTRIKDIAPLEVECSDKEH